MENVSGNSEVAPFVYAYFPLTLKTRLQKIYRVRAFFVRLVTLAAPVLKEVRVY